MQHDWRSHNEGSTAEARQLKKNNGDGNKRRARGSA